MPNQEQQIEVIQALGGYASIGDFLAVLNAVRENCTRAGLLESAEEVKRAREVIQALSSMDGVEQLLFDIRDGLTWNSSPIQCLNRIEQLLDRHRGQALASLPLRSDGE